MLMLILQILALENVVISWILYPPCIYNTLTNRFCYLKFHLKQEYIKKVVTFMNFFPGLLVLRKEREMLTLSLHELFCSTTKIIIIVYYKLSN